MYSSLFGLRHLALGFYADKFTDRMKRLTQDVFKAWISKLKPNYCQLPALYQSTNHEFRGDSPGYQYLNEYI